jgi:RimJ/RimL family protein N-acetyltransferase
MGDKEKTWGKGYATRALARVNRARLMSARAAKDNLGSLQVLEKSGFKITGEGKGFANGRGAEVEEYVLTLLRTS